MTDPVSQAEMIAAVVAATCRREGAARRMREAGNAEVAASIDAEIAALYAVHDVLERHERAMAVVETARTLGEAMNNCQDCDAEFRALWSALAAFDAAGEGESDG